MIATSAGQPGPGPDYRRRHTAPTPSAAASAQQRQRTLDNFLANHNGRGAKDPPAYRATDRPRERRRRATAAAAQPMPQVQPRRERARASVRQQPRGVSAPTEKSELRQQPPPRGVRSEERQQQRSRGVSATREQQPHHQSHTRRERHRIDKRIDHRSEHSRDRRRRPLEPEEDIIVHACHVGGPDDGIFASLPPQRRGLSQSRGLSSPRKVTGRGGRGSERPASMPPARRRASSSDSSDMNSDAGSSSSSSSGSSSSTSSNTSSKKRQNGDPPLRRKSTENTMRTEPSTVVDDMKLDPMQRTPSHLALVDMLEGLWNGPTEASGTMYSSVEAHVGSERWGVQKTPTRCREEADDDDDDDDADDGSSTSSSSSGSNSSLDSSTCPTEPPEPPSHDNYNDSSITFDSLYSCRTQPPSSPATSFLRRHSAHNHVVNGGRPKHHTKSEIVYVKDQLKQIKQQREIIRQRVETEGIANDGTYGGKAEGTHGEKGESFHLDESIEERYPRNNGSSMGASGFGNSSLYISDIESLNLSDIEELKRSSF